MYITPAVSDRIAAKQHLLESARPLSPTIVQKLRERFMLEMTYHSNAIEGNSLTLKETYLILSEGITIKGKSLKEHLEATNHQEALEFIFEQVEHDSRHTISEHLIRELQSLVIGSIDKSIAGVYRTVEVAITASNHQPPLATEVPSMMSDLIRWYRRQQSKLQTIELAAIVHHKLVNIHPFADGNGRTARLLMNIILLQSGFPLVIILKHDRKQYYDSLSKADAGNYIPFVTFISRAVERSLDLYIETIIQHQSKGNRSVPLAVLGKQFGLTQKHLNLLARTGKIDAHKKGRSWVASSASVQHYLDSRKRKKVTKKR